MKAANPGSISFRVRPEQFFDRRACERIERVARNVEAHQQAVAEISCRTMDIVTGQRHQHLLRHPGWSACRGDVLELAAAGVEVIRGRIRIEHGGPAEDRRICEPLLRLGSADGGDPAGV